MTSILILIYHSESQNNRILDCLPSHILQKWYSTQKNYRIRCLLCFVLFFVCVFVCFFPQVTDTKTNWSCGLFLFSTKACNLATFMNPVKCTCEVSNSPAAHRLLNLQARQSQTLPPCENLSFLQLRLTLGWLLLQAPSLERGTSQTIPDYLQKGPWGLVNICPFCKTKVLTNVPIVENWLYLQYASSQQKSKHSFTTILSICSLLLVFNKQCRLSQLFYTVA